MSKDHLPIILMAFGLAWALVAMGCEKKPDSGGRETLVVGLLPAESNEEMIEQFEPMRGHLEKVLGMTVEVFTATDYAGVIEAMRKKRIDVAWFGPLSFVLAEREAGAEAFAVGVRPDGSTTYTSCFLVGKDSTAQTLSDLEGKSMAFVDPASTSGGLFPTFSVKNLSGKMPKQFFGKFTYAGSHDSAVLAVKNQSVDGAVAARPVIDRMLKAGLITEGDPRILSCSEPIPAPPMVYRNDLPAEMKQRIQKIVTTAHEKIKVTGFGNVQRYIAANSDDYEVVRNLVKELQLSRDQILD